MPLRLRLFFRLYPTSFAFVRHERILRQARIPVRPAMLGYNYVFQGELNEGDSGLKVRRV